MATSVIGRLSAVLELDAARFNKGVDKAQKKMKRFGRQMDRVGKDMSRRVTLPLAAAGAGILKVAGDFEAGMNKVQALTGATGKDMESLRKQAKQLGITTQFSASQATDAMGFLAMAGSDTNEILKQMPGTLKLAASAQIDLGTAADIVTNVMKGYGKEAEELNEVNDVLVKTFTSTNTSLEQLGEAMKLAGPVAASAGIQFEQTSAAIGLMGNAGFQGTLAGTALRGAMVRLLNPTAKAEGIMKKLGITVTDSQGRLKGLDEIVQQLEPHAENTGAIMEIFGQRAGPAMAALISQGSDALSDLTTQLENSGGIADKIAKKQMEGFNGAMRELKSALEGAAIAIAESGLLEFATKMAKRIAEWFREMAAINPTLLKWGTLIAAAAAALGPLLVGVGLVTTALSALSVPVLAVVAGIAALTAGFVAFSRTDLGKAAIDAVKDAIWGIRVTIEVVRTAIGPWVDAVVGWFSKLRDSIRNRLGALKEGFETFFLAPLRAVQTKVKEWALTVVEFLLKPFAKFIPAAQDAIDSVKKSFSDAAERIKKDSKPITIEINKSAEAFEDAAEGTDSLAIKMDLLGDNMKKALPFFGNVAESTEEISDEMKDAAAQFNEWADVLQDRLPIAGTRFERLADTLRRVGIEQKKVTSTSLGMGRALDTALKDMHSKMEQHKRDQERIWQNLVDGVQGAWVGFFEDTFQGKGLDSVKDFLGSVKDLFFRLIAEIAAKWTAAKIFGGDFSFSLGGGSGGGSGGGNLTNTAVTAGLKKMFGGPSTTSGAGGSAPLAGGGGGAAGTAAGGGITTLGGANAGLGGGISGASVTGGAQGAGLGGAGAGTGSAAAGMSAMSVAGGMAIFAAGVMALQAAHGKSSRDKVLEDLQRAGPGVAGGLGLQAAAGEKFGFGRGANAGFAADFASRQGIMANEIMDRGQGTGIAAFKDLGLEDTLKLLDEAQKEFEALKKSAQSAFKIGEAGAMQVGQSLQDGVIDQTELADMGFISLGERITNTKSGVERMGDVSVEQFQKITKAVNDGIFRLEALRGETSLNQREIQFLGDAGLTASEGLRALGREGAAALGQIEGAANRAAGALSGIGGEGPRGAASRESETMREINTTQQLRDNATGR